MKLHLKCERIARASKSCVKTVTKRIALSREEKKNMVRHFFHYISSVILSLHCWPCDEYRLRVTECSTNCTHMLNISTIFNWCWRSNRNVHYSCLESIQRPIWIRWTCVHFLHDFKTLLIFYRVSVSTLYIGWMLVMSLITNRLVWQCKIKPSMAWHGEARIG